MERQQGGEAENGGAGGSSSGGNTSSGSRWNPTKEQISVLENMYKQGIRTPSAEQIEQITARLRAYGQIEGKNVFYWFQNHKARQRQRQRQKQHQQQQQQQSNNAFFNRFLHNPHLPHPFSSPLCQNVVCTPSPYCLQQSDFGFYPQHPNVLLPAGSISPRAESLVGPMMMVSPPIYEPWQQRIPDYSFCNSNRKTLDLFPQHPTGTMEGESTENVVSAENQPCFDFFTLGQGPPFSD